MHSNLCLPSPLADIGSYQDLAEVFINSRPKRFSGFFHSPVCKIPQTGTEPREQGSASRDSASPPRHVVDLEKAFSKFKAESSSNQLSSDFPLKNPASGAAADDPSTCSSIPQLAAEWHQSVSGASSPHFIKATEDASTALLTNKYNNEELLQRRFNSDQDLHCEPRKRLCGRKRAAPSKFVESSAREIQWLDFNFTKAEDLAQRIRLPSKESKHTLKNQLGSLTVRIRQRVLQHSFFRQVANKDTKMQAVIAALDDTLKPSEAEAIKLEIAEAWMRIESQVQEDSDAYVSKDGFVLRGQVRDRLSKRRSQKKADKKGKSENELYNLFETGQDVLSYLGPPQKEK